jgi:hypothetical protein
MKHFRTNSDAGSVKVGTPTFTTLINNGYGDGITDVYVLDPDERVPESATFQNCIEGEVYFEKWEDWDDGE